VHEQIADKVIEMLQGAASELVCGDPAQLSTDVGPLIDQEAYAGIQRLLQQPIYKQNQPPALIEYAQRAIDSIASSASSASSAPTHDASISPHAASSQAPAHLLAPQIIALENISDLRQEVFAPVLHIVRYAGDPQAVIQQINALGYGLTLGIQTRIDSRAQQLATAAHIGNVYINRNMIGAVVGSQPFGGEGLSGTGPKAGGPHYLYRFCAEQTITVNTAAAGGNAALLAGH
jgi:RHH-type proline utilization regulon transcriptional repressor/proline dehydrogenase/delta 1-pyrroline-5-carboxylate dehydrogenase